MDFGGLDGQANFGYDLLVTKDRLIASAPGVGYGQGEDPCAPSRLKNSD